MTKSINTPARRILSLAVAATLGAAALPAAAMDSNLERSVPNWISAESFNNMTQNEIYKVDLAQKRGHRVVIEGYSPSQSRSVVDEALAGGQTVSRSGNTAFGNVQANTIPGKGQKHPASINYDIRR